MTKIKLGDKSGIAMIFPAWAPLSDQIYKIRTLLSTGFVDKTLWADEPTPRRALYGAGFWPSHPLHWQRGHSPVHRPG
jgi:hypothetical protein